MTTAEFETKLEAMERMSTPGGDDTDAMTSVSFNAQVTVVMYIA